MNRHAREWYGLGIGIGGITDMLWGNGLYNVVIGIGFMLSALFRVKHVRKGRSIYGPFTILHAADDGGPVLRGQSSWRTSCGFMVQTKRNRWIVLWREDGE